MTRPEAFQGTPWNTEPTEQWNRPAHWDDYYPALMSDRESPERRDWAVHRDTNFLVRALPRLLPLPLPGTAAPRLLDAGCGVSLIPHVLAYWGLRVTAVDFSARAIEIAREQRPEESELARCIQIRVPITEYGMQMCELVDDPQRSLQKLREWQAPGGSVTYVLADWASDALGPASLELIYCRNSLRASTKPYWRAALTRFRELLAPGGVLLLETLNAIGIQEEVEELLREVGLVALSESGERSPGRKYVWPWWPTG